MAFSFVKDTNMRLLVVARYFDNNFSRFDTILDCDRQTDGHLMTAFTKPIAVVLLLESLTFMD